MTKPSILLILFHIFANGLNIRFRWNFNNANSNSLFDRDLVASHYCTFGGYRTATGLFCDTSDYVDLLSIGAFPFPLSIVFFAFVPPGMADPILVYDAHRDTVDLFTLNTRMIYKRCTLGSSTTFTTSGISISGNEWIAMGVTIYNSRIEYHIKHQGGTQQYIYFNPSSKSYTSVGHIHIGHDMSAPNTAERVILNQVFICDPISSAEFTSIYTTFGFESLPSKFLSDKNYLVYFLPSTSGQIVPDTGDSGARTGQLGFLSEADSDDPTYLGSDGLLFSGGERVYTASAYAIPMTKAVSMWLYFPCNITQDFILFNRLGGSTHFAKLIITTSNVNIFIYIASSSIEYTLASLEDVCEKWTFVYVGFLEQSTTSTYLSFRINSFSKGPYLFFHQEYFVGTGKTYFGYFFKGKIRYIAITSDPGMMSTSKGHYLYETVDSPLYTFCTERQYLDIYGVCIFCSLTTYPDFYAQGCFSCLQNCSLCTNATDCSVCITGNYFHYAGTQVQCRNPCPAGFFANTTSGNCESCLDNCEVCLDSTSCSLCFANYYCGVMHQFDPSHTCSSNCPTFYYGNTTLRECKHCIAHCQSCTTSTDCTECFLGYYINTFSSGINSCESCMVNCFDCSSENDCTTCNNTYYLHSAPTPDQCLIPCPEFYYEESDMTCQSCLGNCKICDNSTQCVTCDSSYFRYRPSSGNDQCINPCLPFYYEAPDQTCKSCLDHCEECTNNTRCVSCGSLFYLLDNKNGTDSCVNPCPDYYYENSISSHCENCLSHCAKCDNQTICNSCGSGFYLYRISGFDDICVYPCPIYFFESPDGICDHCLQRCQNCTCSTDCQICDPDYFLDTFSNGTQQCINPCREGFYESGGVCYPCLTYCKKCTNNSICLECYSPYSIKYNRMSGVDSCVSDCGIKYYSTSNRVCHECDFRCLTCSGGSNFECPDCDFSYEGIARTGANTCNCSTGYVANLTSLQCESCDDSMCEICSIYDLSSCSACKTNNPAIIHDPTTMSCICRPGKYRIDSQCFSCDSLCAECTGPGNKNCKPYKCKNQAYAIESPSTCLYMCKAAENNMFLDLDLELCRYCVSPCQACFAANDQSCTSCIEGYLLMESTCIDRCPTKFYNSSNICLPCDVKCKDCVDRTNYCINGCESPYLYKNHQCLESCGDGYTGVQGYCETCNSGCQLCYTLSDNTTKVCTKCVSGQYLYQGECNAVCPIGRYGDVETGKCELCTEACSSCFNGTYKDCVT